MSGLPSGKEKETSQRVHEPLRQRDGTLLREDYPVEAWGGGEYLAIHGPVLLQIEKPLLDKVLKVPQDSLVGTGRWNVNRLGRFGHNLDTRSGFEGYVISSAPASMIPDLVRLSGRSIAGMLNPSALNNSNPDAWKTVIAKNNRRLEKIVETLRAGSTLNEQDMEFCFTLFQLLIGRFRALPNNTDLYGRRFTPSEASAFNSFRQNTASLASAGRYPTLKAHYEGDGQPGGKQGKLLSVQNVWPMDPAIGVEKSHSLTRAGQDAVGKLVIDLLQELGRFGNPLVRSTLANKPHGLFR